MQPLETKARTIVPMRLFVLSALLIGSTPVSAAEIVNPRGVVELFTSQGCSSCPPADRVLAEIAARGDMLALAWHVDYWDYIGWKDSFARPENAKRQRAYAASLGSKDVYTPQAIINRLAEALDGILLDEMNAATFAELGAELPSAQDRGPAALAKLVAEEVPRWAEIVRSARIAPVP